MGSTTSSSPIDPPGFAAATQVPVAVTPVAAVAGESITLPEHERHVAVRAVDDAGNVGGPARLDTGAGAEEGPGGEGPEGTGSEPSP
jgi:hypothetical protein